MIEHFPRSNTPPDTRLKAFTGPVHCQNLSQNGHRGTTKSFSGQTQDQNKSFCSCQHTTNLFFLFYLFILILIFFFKSKHFLRSSTWQKRNSQFEHTTKNLQKPRYFLGSIHDQTFPQVDHTNKNLLSGTNNSKMLLGSKKNVRQTSRKFRVNAGQMELKH